MAIGLDTSVVVRLLVGLPLREYRAASDRLEKAYQAQEIVIVTDLVLAETYHALRHHYEVPDATARERLLELVTSGLVVPEPAGAVRALAVEGGELMDRMIHQRHRSLDALTVTFDRRQGRLEGSVLLGA